MKKPPKILKVQNEKLWSLFSNSYHDTLDETSYTPDTILKVGVEKREFYCHRLMLITASNFLREILLPIAPETTPLILLPDLSASGFEFFMKYIYYGEVEVPMNYYTEFTEACKLLQLKDTLEIEEAEIEQEEEEGAQIFEKDEAVSDAERDDEVAAEESEDARDDEAPMVEHDDAIDYAAAIDEVIEDEMAVDEIIVPNDGEIPEIEFVTLDLEQKIEKTPEKKVETSKRRISNVAAQTSTPKTSKKQKTDSEVVSENAPSIIDVEEYIPTQNHKETLPSNTQATKCLVTNVVKMTPDLEKSAQESLINCVTNIYKLFGVLIDEKIKNNIKNSKIIIENEKLKHGTHLCGFCDKSFDLKYQFNQQTNEIFFVHGYALGNHIKFLHHNSKSTLKSTLSSSCSSETSENSSGKVNKPCSLISYEKVQMLSSVEKIKALVSLRSSVRKAYEKSEVDITEQKIHERIENSELIFEGDTLMKGKHQCGFCDDFYSVNYYVHSKSESLFFKYDRFHNHLKTHGNLIRQQKKTL